MMPPSVDAVTFCSGVVSVSEKLWLADCWLALLRVW
jgi:hypothetical protein